MKKLVSIVLGFAAAFAFADEMPEVQVLTFVVSGAEKYEDGSALADGECFALVWSDGKQPFAGIDADGKAKREGDEVVYIGKIVKDSPVTFQIANGFKSDGTFEIWVLDTRVFDNGEVKSIGKTEDGNVIVSKASKATESIVVDKVPASVDITDLKSWGQTADDVNAPQITDIVLEGENVKIKIGNVIKGVNYMIVGSASLEMTNPKAGFMTSATGDTMTLVAPKSFGSFFKVKALAK